MLHGPSRVGHKELTSNSGLTSWLPLEPLYLGEILRKRQGSLQGPSTKFSWIVWEQISCMDPGRQPSLWTECRKGHLLSLDMCLTWLCLGSTTNSDLGDMKMCWSICTLHLQLPSIHASESQCLEIKALWRCHSITPVLSGSLRQGVCAVISSSIPPLRVKGLLTR